MLYNRWNDRPIAIVRECCEISCPYSWRVCVEIFEYLRLVQADKVTVPGLLAHMYGRRRSSNKYLATGPTQMLFIDVTQERMVSLEFIKHSNH